MIRLCLAACLLAMAGAASAQDTVYWQGGHRVVVRTHAFEPGQRVDRGAWYRARTVDWRLHRLRRPPVGYQWREVGGAYVLAASTTGLVYDTAPIWR